MVKKILRMMLLGLLAGCSQFPCHSAHDESCGPEIAVNYRALEN